jgi:hypothetical protein
MRCNDIKAVVDAGQAIGLGEVKRLDVEVRWGDGSEGKGKEATESLAGKGQR